jgi:FAD/FMN-containing dehydrogenase
MLEGAFALFVYQSGFGLAQDLWADIAPSATDRLRSRLGSAGRVVLPGDADFLTQKRNYNRRINVTPELIVLCHSAAAVSAAVAWAAEEGVKVVARSGGHAYEGFPASTQAVVDVRGLDDIEINVSQRRARIGAGARLHQVYSALAPYQLVLPAGTCGTVGVAGLALGGGYGFLSRKWGLTADHITAFYVVDAKGRRRWASPTFNSDLFWACRGGGGNFGVITDFYFRLRPATDVVVFQLDWPSAQAWNVVAHWQRWAPQAADEVNSQIHFTGWPGRDLRIRCRGQICVGADGRAPTVDSAARLLSPLTTAVPPASRLLQRKSFSESVAYWGGNPTTSRVYFKSKSDYALARLTATGIRTLLSALRNLEAGPVTVTLSAYGGAINRIASEETAFPHRTALYGVKYYSEWSDPSQTGARMQALRELDARMSRYFSGYAYANYTDAEEANWQRAYYGGNYARLTDIKTRRDPTNLFDQGPQGIRPNLAAAAAAPAITAVEPAEPVRLGPNPWRADRHRGVPVTFYGLQDGDEVTLFTVAGQYVTGISATGSQATWNLTNASGDPVASGMYLYLTRGSKKQRGVLAVIR